MRERFHQLPKAKKGGKLAGPQRHAAAFDTRLGSALAGGAGYGIAHKLQGRGYGLVKNPKASSWMTHMGRFVPARSSASMEWGAQLVRASVGKADGWAIWDKMGQRVGRVVPLWTTVPGAQNFLDLVSNTSELRRSCALTRAGGFTRSG